MVSDSFLLPVKNHAANDSNLHFDHSHLSKRQFLLRQKCTFLHLGLVQHQRAVQYFGFCELNFLACIDDVVPLINRKLFQIQLGNLLITKRYVEKN